MFATSILASQGDTITLAVSGHVGLDAVPEIERLLAQGKHVVLDLSEVTLLDREALTYLSQRLAEGVEVVNCPPYLTDWIRK